MREAASTRSTAFRARSRRPWGARSSRRFAIGHLLHLKFRQLEGVIPIRRQNPAILVVAGQPSDLRLDELQSALVAQVLGVLFQVGLQAPGALDQAREILGQRELRALRPQDFLDAPSRGEADARDAVRVPQPHANHRGGQAFLVLVAANATARSQPHRRRRLRISTRSCVWTTWTSSKRSTTRPWRNTKKRNSMGSRPVRGSNRLTSSRTISRSGSRLWVQDGYGEGRAADPCQNSKTNRPADDRCRRTERKHRSMSRGVRRYPNAPNMHTAASKVLPKSNERMSPRTNRTWIPAATDFSRARTSIAGDRSTPVTWYPRRASGRS